MHVLLQFHVQLYFQNLHVWFQLNNWAFYLYADHCYKRIKTEKDWSFNQFAEYASEYSAYWLELVSVSSSDLTQSLFSFFNISLFNIIFLSTSHSTRTDRTSLKKFIYLMIDAIERLNNTRKFDRINDKTVWIARQLIAH